MFLPVMMIALLFIGQSAYAQQSATGLKDIYANYFRIGTCYPTSQVQSNNTQLQNVILREFNSLTHENELKPENTMVQNGSTDNDIKVQLRDGAKAVMKFATDNNIPLRGHTLVWHQQTPNWFFYANMQNASGNLATKDVMNKRMESYIKNMFALINTEFPNLKLYAYDVVNEIFLDDGKPREAGDPSTNDDKSTWVKIYGNNSFADSAFVYARKYAPSGCKLFYNDFNEYTSKRDSIVALYTRLKAKGVIDGIGMQSHLSTGWPDIGTYKTALNMFNATGAEIHVTELDLTIESGSDEATQAEKYKSVFQALKEAREEGANITSVSVWGVIDEWSWRNDRNPLLLKTQSYTKKPAYNKVAELIPAKDHGSGTNPQFNTPKPEEVKADKNGFFFFHDFEDGTTQGWARRGPNETVVNSSTQKNSGSKSIYISGRSENWNGAQFALPDRAFKAGDERSFSVMARHEGSGTLKFKLSLQYNNTANETQYPNIDSVEAASGKWVQLATTNYKLPEGTGFSIYVELENTSSFYVDDAMGGVAGATVKTDGTPGDPPSTPSSSSVKASSSSSSVGASSSSSSKTSSSSGSSSSAEDSQSSSSDEGDDQSSSSDDGDESSSSSDDPISPIRLISNISKTEFSVSSLNGKSLLVESKSGAAIYLYNIKGDMMQKIETPAGRSVVRLSVPNGIYVVKNAGTGQAQKVLVK